MSTLIEISDDDDSFNCEEHVIREAEASFPGQKALNSDSSIMSLDDTNLTSDEEDELPTVALGNRKAAAIKKLFPNVKNTLDNFKFVPKASYPTPEAVIVPQPLDFEKMVGGIKINLPVNPYGCQIALMFKIVTAINKGQNCLLESPTGSGKTLALLCATLAWQKHEQDRSSQQLAQQYFSSHPELSNVNGAKEYIASSSSDTSPEKLFGKTTFGEKSIYDAPVRNGSGDGSNDKTSKRQEPIPDTSEKETLVNIHKKPRLFSDSSDATCASPQLPSTPEKTNNVEEPETPQHIRVPIIYYGARTHKQIQQVVKEFKRTSYCGVAKMTLLSSREYACVREMDRSLWKSKDDMCRGCVKSFQTSDKTKKESNCKYYDNRAALNHRALPPAFDLEDLVSKGQELNACPFYAARQMATQAKIIFCPYNYLIQPSIRNSMQIELKDNIVIIDEGHNIEDICRDAATFTFTRDNIGAAIKELQTVSQYRYSNEEVVTNIDYLSTAMKSWDTWFVYQLPLLENTPVNNNEAVYTWQVDHFIETLNNNNIGRRDFPEFKASAEVFCKRLRDDPRTLFGVTQATGTLLESVATVLDYLFGFDGKYTNDFKPALIKTITSTPIPGSTSWRSSQFGKSVVTETLSLRVLCLYPGAVFGGLATARCVLLASGTLAPLSSLQSELGAPFPLMLSPNHIIPPDRVWIGSLSTNPDGSKLECSRRGLWGPGAGGGAGSGTGGGVNAGGAKGMGAAILHVCRVTPNGVLCFMPSYSLLNTLAYEWRRTRIWDELEQLKHVFIESRNVKDHEDIMKDYYKYAVTDEGALLFAVYRGKVSEGMDFKDQQARAVITIGIPYPNVVGMEVKEKMKYNDKYSRDRGLLPSTEWLRVQAYRALNQAVGRCVRHRLDWGAVLLIDARFSNPYYTEHLSKWVKNILGNNHHTFDSLVNSPNSLESFMQNMKIRENEDINLT